ncbi:organomercurial lyase [Haloarcula sp. 1CSR25-25]|uniref:organomercurial lyase n=1 Tax=Haloarcula sp. 1CSR25-25 TaxID=2862545 RepID=UPI002895EDB6|nr:organomercurial lyase [Haloarcula sp. 1CSR25-25]MDT3434877.1 alkylmercury lyase family protein [Haloarcula sp. 1CSR25-25]
MCDTETDTTTVDVTDGCCGVNPQETAPEGGSGHWLGEAGLDQRLPEDLRTALGRFFGVESVDTLAEWSEQIRRQTGGGSLDADQLCHTDEETDHWGEVTGERHHFRCFYDAIILAALEHKPVEVHTVSPDGVVIEARAVGSEELSVDPETAVFSLGIGLDAHEESGGDPTLQDSYAAICPYVKAFADRDAYDRWADVVPAATVATPLSSATAFARALTTEGDDEQK